MRCTWFRITYHTSIRLYSEPWFSTGRRSRVSTVQKAFDRPIVGSILGMPGWIPLTMYILAHMSLFEYRSPCTRHLSMITCRSGVGAPLITQRNEAISLDSISTSRLRTCKFRPGFEGLCAWERICLCVSAFSGSGIACGRGSQPCGRYRRCLTVQSSAARLEHVSSCRSGTSPDYHQCVSLVDRRSQTGATTFVWLPSCLHYSRRRADPISQIVEPGRWHAPRREVVSFVVT